MGYDQQTWSDNNASYPLSAARMTNLENGVASSYGAPVGGLTGATAATRYAGATTSGAPSSGTFNTGDFVIDRSGAIWVCTSGGSPGTWTEVGGSVAAATPTPNIPVLSGVTVGAYTSISIDPASETWDCGAGGVPVFGTANGGITSSPDTNAFLDAAGILHIRLASATDAVTITTFPAGSPNNFGDGAAVGFTFQRGIVEASIRVPGASGACYGWPSFWAQAIQGHGGGSAYAEIDVYEGAGWSAGSGVSTLSYHYDTSSDPNGEAFSGLNIADGNWHTITLVRLPATMWACWDGIALPSTSGFTNEDWSEGSDIALLLTHGYTSGVNTPPYYPQDMEVRYISYWYC